MSFISGENNPINDVYRRAYDEAIKEGKSPEEATEHADKVSTDVSLRSAASCVGFIAGATSGAAVGAMFLGPVGAAFGFVAGGLFAARNSYKRPVSGPIMAATGAAIGLTRGD